jgi:D-serine deaminase-like pyridoxal phosphate-dependent protein
MTGLGELSTPALVVDVPTFDANVAAAGRLAADHGKVLRPHVKTHRTPALALRQLGPGTGGVTCATVGEAEVMAAAGINDLLIANEVVTPAKLERAAVLAARARVTLAVDDAGVARSLSAAAYAAGVHVAAVVDVDVGLARCGVKSPGEAVALAVELDDLPNVDLVGLMGYEGRLRASQEDRGERTRHAFESIAAVKRAFEAAGLPVAVVSAAGTSTLVEALRDASITEIQAGTYALMEHDLDGLGLSFHCAALVVATVISRSGGRAVLDAGRKTLGCEYGPPKTVDAALRVVGLSEEHVVIECDGREPAIGSQVGLRPSQIRTTFNLYDWVWLSGPEGALERVPVAARGASS